MIQLTYFSNRSNEAKINESLFKIVCSSLVQILMERIILCKINAISGWVIETVYLVIKNTNLGSSTIHLVCEDMIEIAN